MSSHKVIFEDECYIVEFDLDLPVVCIFDPDYEAPDDDEDEEYWYEKEEVLLPWWEMEDESEVFGYTWEDVENDSEYQALQLVAAVRALSGDPDSDYEEWSDDESLKSDGSNYEIEVEYMDIEVNTEEESKEERKEKKDDVYDQEVQKPTQDKPNMSSLVDIPKSTRNKTSADKERNEPQRNQQQNQKKTPSKLKVDESQDNKPASKGNPLKDNRRDSDSQKKERNSNTHSSSSASKPKMEESLDEKKPASKKEALKNRKSENRSSVTKSEKLEHSRSSMQDTSQRSSQSSVQSRRSSYKRRRQSFLQQMHPFAKPDWTNTRSVLKKTENGAGVAGKLEEPTTFPNQREDRGVNSIANQGALKKTQKGRAVRKGANLAKPVTHINRAMNDLMDKKLIWSKPEWAQKKSLLKKTEKGSDVKEGKTLEKNITAATSMDDPNIRWEKPEWAQKRVIKSTEKGESVLKGENLQRNSNDSPKLDLAWEKPDWAKNKRTKAFKSNRSEDLLKTRTKSCEWEKPDWAKGEKTPLRRTKTGELLKRMGKLEKPITPNLNQGK